MGFIPPPSRMISIANTTFASAANKTLDFDISTTNATLNRWTVDLQQNNTTIRSFPPTVDTRGPGTSTGVNPLHVSLPWDGLDAANHTVSGNVTWLINARTTNYVSGGPVNDRIDSAQATVNGSLSDELGEIKKLEALVIPMFDIHNEPIAIPQYDRVRGRKKPIALPVRRAIFDEIFATFDITLPQDAEPDSYLIWGESGGNILFSGNKTLINGLNTVAVGYNLPKIAKYDKIDWYCSSPKGNNIRKSLGSSDSPIYAVLDQPQPPQTIPREDVVDFAVETQKFNNDTLNELRIGSYLTTRIYKDSGFEYDEDGEEHHTKTLDRKGRVMRFRVSNFLTYSGNPPQDNLGNCQDFSNLFQVCSASLGVKTFQVRRIDGPFAFRRVWPVGFPTWFEPDDYQLEFHQTGYSTQHDSIFDPTYQLDNGGLPTLPINMTPADYRLLLQDRNRKPKKWKEQMPVIPLEVN